ncbi:CorA family divalent cation transporter [Ligaoa zhengdingensis]|uniref:magnesium transporter CorA family protein n=1 Tax=Ligaoa zhengdingensis TaxID=2763658 RepID=UPI0031B9CD94
MFYTLGENLEPWPEDKEITWDHVLGLLPQEEASLSFLPDRLAAYRPLLLKTVRFCKVENEADYLYGTLLIPGKGESKRKQGISFFLWDGNLLLIGDDSFLSAYLLAFQSVKSRGPIDAGLVFCDLLNYLIGNDLTYLEELENRAERMESAVLSDSTEHFDHRMMGLRKELAAFSHYYSQLADLSVSIQENADSFFSEKELRALRLFAERAERLRQETQMLREYSMQIREVYQAQIDIRQNKIMKILTIVTTIFLPLSLIAGWYGMNFVHMPELSWRFGYPAVCLLSAAIVLFCIWFFKKKRFW